MSDELKVAPTPIQRNINDVAMELTQLYYSRQNSSEYTVDRIQDVYQQFYAIAMVARGMSSKDAHEIANVE